MTGRYFVGVGAQKAGTTWLHDQLALHPEVALPQRKEIHYFDMVCENLVGRSFGHRSLKVMRRNIEALARSRPGGPRTMEKRDSILGMCDVLELAFSGPAGYRDLLEASATPATRRVGEITPGYSTLARSGFEHMAEVLDRPKVIFIMRDPLTRHWSAVRQANRHDPSRMPWAFEHTLKQPANWTRSDYETTVRNLDSVFGADDVLYLFYEELTNERTLQRIAEFLGVATTWPWELAKATRVGRPMDMPTPSPRLLANIQPIYDFTRERFGGQVPAAWGGQ